MVSDKQRQLSIEEIKDVLSEEEFSDAKKRIDRAEQTLEDVKILLSNAMFLHNGKLSAGTIEYAAFRIETLSLIFETARSNFRKSSKDGDKAYQTFLRELGEDVGFTFARDLLNRLSRKNLFLHVQDVKKLLKLWASFENESGAGCTTVTHCSKDKITIHLKNNPLRRRESDPHAHCGFYLNYMIGLINEMLTTRARHLQNTIGDANIHADKVCNIKEEPDADDCCVFHVTLRPEKLKRAFDILYEAYNHFYSYKNEDDFFACASEARAALVAAQMETLNIDTERPPKQFFKVFKKHLDRNEYRVMDNIYQVTSKYVHRESVSASQLNRIRCWEILRDIRRSIYALEQLELSQEDKEKMKKEASIVENVTTLKKVILESDRLTTEERKDVEKILAGIQKSVHEVTKEEQATLIQCLRKMGGNDWEVAKAVMIEVLTESSIKELGIE